MVDVKDQIIQLAAVCISVIEQKRVLHHAAYGR